MSLETNATKTAPIGSMSRRDVVVGVDGSRSSEHALQWAVRHTAKVGQVRPVAAWTYPWWAVSSPVPMAGVTYPADSEYFADEAQKSVTEFVDRIGSDEMLPPIVARGHAGKVLVEEARSADLLVVGSRGRGAVAGVLLGSTSSYCASHASTPVLIVPEWGDLEQAIEHVAVGVDGSENGVRALEWAIDFAPSAAVVDVYHSWNAPMSFEGFVGAAIEQIEQAGQRTLDESVDRALVGREARADRVVRHLTVGDPRAVLRDNDADMIVVGARGHHGLAFLLLGSTAYSLSHHPTVPTVIVHDPMQRRDR